MALNGHMVVRIDESQWYRSRATQIWKKVVCVHLGRDGNTLPSAEPERSNVRNSLVPISLPTFFDMFGCPYLKRRDCFRRLPLSRTCHLHISSPSASSLIAAKSLSPLACAVAHAPAVDPASTVEPSCPVADAKTISSAVVPSYRRREVYCHGLMIKAVLLKTCVVC